MRRRVVIGIPLYGGDVYLREALESLLTQTYRDFAIVVVADAATRETETVIEDYASYDSRIHFEHNRQRLGLTRNWLQTFVRARELVGTFDYFAWGSDHDVWHPRWLATLVATLDERESAVLTYPLDVGIASDGTVIRETWTFDTAGERIRERRFRHAIRRMSAGNMVYGLFRARCLERCEVFRTVVLPDRLLLAELSLHGEFVQVPEILWFRRYPPGVRPSLARQRRSFYPDGVPLRSYIPWPVTHAAALMRSLVLRGNGRPQIGRLNGVAWTVWYFVLSVAFDIGHRTRVRARLRGSLVRLLRRIRHPRSTARAVVRRIRRAPSRLLSYAQRSRKTSPARDVKLLAHVGRRPISELHVPATKAVLRAIQVPIGAVYAARARRRTLTAAPPHSAAPTSQDAALDRAIGILDREQETLPRHLAGRRPVDEHRVAAAEYEAERG